MKKNIMILALLLISPMIAMAEDDNRICDAKDQSSAEQLLKTVFACQNTKRTKELMNVVFLGTNVNDKILGVNEEDGMLIPDMLQDQSISIKDWRAKKLMDFTDMDKKDLNAIEVISVGQPIMHDQNPLKYQSEQTFEKALVRYQFKSVDPKNQEKSGTKTGRHLIVFLKGKAYLNLLDYDLWELNQ